MQYRTTKRESFFLTIYTVYMIVLLLSQTAFEEMGAASAIFKYVRYLCYFLAALIILQDSYREKQIWGVAILGVLTVGTVVCSGNSTFILYLIMILAAKEVNVRTIVKLTCIIQGAMLLSIVAMSQIGIIPDYIFDASTRQRHGLGFLWTTTGAILYFYFMVLYIYLREERAHLIEYVILEAVNFGLYKLTDARMSFYLSTLLLIYVYVMRFYWQNRKDRIRKNRLLIGAPAFFCILAVACQIFYIPTDARWQKINSVLSGRLELGCFGWRDYGFSLLGTKIEWIGFSHNATAGTYNYVDCSYMQILLENGLIPLIIIIAVYTYIMYMAVKEKDFYLQTAVLLITAFPITEPRLLNLAYNPLPFFGITYISLRGRSALFHREGHRLNRRVRFRTTHVRLKARK